MTVLEATGLVKEGRIYSLARERFRGMPLFPGHPQFEVLVYRTPQGLRAEGDEPWGPGNDAGLGYLSEIVFGTTHTGAHVDAHAHMTVGDDDRWYGGCARTDLGDFGPLKGDASELPPFWARGLLYDVPGFRGIEFLGKGEPVSAGELREIGRAQGIGEPTEGDVVLVRTGYMSHFPDAERMAAHRGPGPDLTVARWLAECGVLATGSATETYEVQPYLLIERGVYLMESVDLEELARDRVYEFLFVALPLKIRGATGSMIDAVAVV
jgi:kynurenine formamidase